MTQHHIDPTTLIEYAAGNLPEPVAMLTATHMALCPTCRQTNAMLEDAGGALIDDALTDAKPGEMGPSATLRKAVFDRLEDDDLSQTSSSAHQSVRPDLIIPRPLRDYLGDRVEALEFRKIANGLEAIDILPDYPQYTTRLMRISASKSMPMHAHNGVEYTLVLEGGFSDGSNVYHRGDVAVADADIEHKPVAEPGVDCLCLAVNHASVRLTGPLGRLLNPFVKF